MKLPDTTSISVVSAILPETFPSLPLRGLRLVLAGDEFDTWSVAGAIIKFPKTKAHAEKVGIERALHDELSTRLGTLFPEIVAMSEPNGVFPYAMNAYRPAAGHPGQTAEGPMVRPKPWARKRLSTDVAGALASLHKIPIRKATAAGVKRRKVHVDHWLDASEASIDRARRVAGDVVDEFVGSPLPPEARKAGASVLCHADLKGEHLFVSEDSTRLTAVIDWSDMSIAEPAVDLAGLTIWLGPSFVRSVAREYGADEGTAERAIYLGRAGLLKYLDAIAAGDERAPERALLDAQLRAAFST